MARARLPMLPPRVRTLDTRIARPPSGEARFGSRERGYDREWTKAAAAYKLAHCWCIGCAAIGERAAVDVVDHVEPHRGDRLKFWDTTNWQPACTWHHNAVKATLEVMWDRGEISSDALRLDSGVAISLTKRLRDNRMGGLIASEG